MVRESTICTESPTPPGEETLLRYSRVVLETLGKNLGDDKQLWVLTKTGEIKRAREVHFPTELNPERNWETYSQYVPGLSFISLKRHMTRHR